MEVTCLNCNHVVKLPYEISYKFYICPKCCNIHKGKDGVLKLENTVAVSSFEFHIPIGTAVVLENKIYCVSNAILKKDTYNEYWREYELISENNNKKYFTEENGNWTISEAIEFDRNTNVQEIYYNDSNFSLFDKGEYCETSGVGFFDYKIDHEEYLSYSDFICPPNLLSVEEEGNEKTIYFGEHISKNEIKKIFNIKTVPSHSKTGMVQPFYFNLNKTIIIFSSTCILILISHLFFYQNSKNQLVYSNTIDLGNNNNNEISTDVFELNGPIAPLKIYIESDVDNSWVATDFSLVNQTTSESSYFSKDVEYYHGYEGGENWTEGNTQVDFNICGVSSGKYKITFTPNKDSNDAFNSRLKIDVYWNKSDNWNFTFVFVVFLAITFFLFLIRNSFEQRRWSDSDYSPYTKED